jgi:ATP-dependent DNA ligase
MEPFLKPMLCGSAQAPPTGGAWVYEPKIDGWRGLTWVDPSGLVSLYARSGASYTGKLPYIEEELLANLPHDTALDGELIGSKWGDVQGVMTRGAGAHVPSEAVPALTYVVFDITRLNGNDLRKMPWEDRRSLLEQIEWDEYVVLNAYDEDPDAHDRYLALGYEGTVAKRRTATYTGGRAQSWLKIKPKETAEGEVIGFKDGTAGTALDGKVGAFRVRMLASGAETTVKCGTQARHEDATANPNNWLGVVIEISHHGIGDTGKPRHPSFVRRRDDHEGPQETPRQRQVRLAMEAEKVSKKGERGEPKMGRMRNYAAMGDDKLVRVREELRAGINGAGGEDAYDRCMNGGSGEPVRDLAVVEQLMREKGLL